MAPKNASLLAPFSIQLTHAAPVLSRVPAPCSWFIASYCVGGNALSGVAFPNCGPTAPSHALPGASGSEYA